MDNQKDPWDMGLQMDEENTAAEGEMAAQDEAEAQDISAQNAGQNITSRVCPRGYTRYTWRSTDTLASVASRYGLKPDAISEANPGIVFTRLNFGDEICIPYNKIACSSGSLYTVRRGDTFTSIAAKYGVPVYTLTELNPYVDPTTLQIGQQICVPANRPVPPIAPPITPPVYPGPGTGSGGGSTGTGCASNNISILMPMGWSYGTVLTRYGISFNALQAANPGLNVEAIPSGQKLCIPPAGSRRLCEQTNTRSHIIERGETLDTLARRFNTSVSRLLRINPDLAPADFIAGRVICVPE